jgi:hypothetical protein
MLGIPGFRGTPFDLVDPHLTHEDVVDLTTMRTTFGLWFRVMFFHRADDEFAVALAHRTVTRSMSAFE